MLINTNNRNFFCLMFVIAICCFMSGSHAYAKACVMEEYNRLDFSLSGRVDTIEEIPKVLEKKYNYIIAQAIEASIPVEHLKLISKSYVTYGPGMPVDDEVKSYHARDYSKDFFDTYSADFSYEFELIKSDKILPFAAEMQKKGFTFNMRHSLSETCR